MAIGDYWELAILGFDGLLAYGLYKAYKNYMAEADALDRVPLFTVGRELQSSIDLSPNKCLPYVGICGLSRISDDVHLKSSNSTLGLIHDSSIFEHKSIRIQGLWSEVVRRISNMTRTCRFGIVLSDPSSSPGTDPAVFVEVAEPLSGSHLLENLPVVFEDFQPATPGFLVRGVDVLFGEVVRGYQFRECMLPEGTPLLGIGKVYTFPGNPLRLCIGPPEIPGGRYVLTTLTKSQLVGSMRSDAWITRWMFCLSLAAGTALTAWLAYKFFRRNSWLSRPVRTTPSARPGVKVDAGVNPSQSALSTAASPEQNDNACSVCLSSQRNVLLMPCRHLTVCSTCCNALPSPKKCPVCRALVKECVPVFVT